MIEIDKDYCLAKKVGPGYLSCGLMLDSNRFLIGLSQKSCFFYLDIGKEFKFAPFNLVHMKLAHNTTAPH